MDFFKVSWKGKENPVISLVETQKDLEKRSLTWKELQYWSIFLTDDLELLRVFNNFTSHLIICNLFHILYILQLKVLVPTLCELHLFAVDYCLAVDQSFAEEYQESAALAASKDVEQFIWCIITTAGFWVKSWVQVELWLHAIQFVRAESIAHLAVWVITQHRQQHCAWVLHSTWASHGVQQYTDTQRSTSLH